MRDKDRRQLSEEVGSISRLRLDLLSNGYKPVPVTSPSQGIPGAGKAPILKNWPQICANATEDVIRSWMSQIPGSTNTGILCRNLIAVDIDVYDPCLVYEIQGRTAEILGTTPLRRIGEPPKCLWVYRSSERMSKIQTGRFKLGSDQENCVEILAGDHQFVAFGEHPKTGKPYVWEGEDPSNLSFSELPQVSRHDCKHFIDAATRLLELNSQKSTSSVIVNQMVFNTEVAFTDFQTIRDALDYVPNTDLHYDDWIKIGFAIKHGLNDEGLPLWMDWSATSSKNDPNVTRKKWNQLTWQNRGKSSTVTVGTLFHIAQSNGWRRNGSDSSLKGLKPKLIPADETLASSPKAKFDDGRRDHLAKPEQRFKVISLEEARRLPRPVYLVDEFVLKDSDAVLYGDPAAMKSFVAISLACCIASGVDWMGRAVSRGGVLLIAGEGASGLAQRIDAFVECHALDSNLQIKMICDNADLYSEKADTNALEQIAQEYQPALIIWDTLSQHSAGASENSDDMKVVISNMRRVRKKCHATNLIIAHPGKDRSRGVRGWSGLLGNVDTMVRQSRDGTVITLSCEKQKDAEQFEKIYLSFEQMGLQGIPAIITSAEKPFQSNRGNLKNTNERIAYDALMNLFVDAPRYEKNNLPYITETAWRSACKNKGLGGTENKNSQQKAFKRVFSKFQENIFFVRDERIFLTSALKSN